MSHDIVERYENNWITIINIISAVTSAH